MKNDESGYIKSRIHEIRCRQKLTRVMMITLLKAIHFPFSRALAFKLPADTPRPFADLRVHFFMAFTAFGEVARFAYFDRAEALTRRITK